MIDGDTLQSDGEIIQLYGIDAPELGQTCLRENEPWPCGVEAALALQKMVKLSESAGDLQALERKRTERWPER